MISSLQCYSTSGATWWNYACMKLHLVDFMNICLFSRRCKKCQDYIIRVTSMTDWDIWLYIWWTVHCLHMKSVVRILLITFLCFLSILYIFVWQNNLTWSNCKVLQDNNINIRTFWNRILLCKYTCMSRNVSTYCINWGPWIVLPNKCMVLS